MNSTNVIDLVEEEKIPTPFKLKFSPEMFAEIIAAGMKATSGLVLENGMKAVLDVSDSHYRDGKDCFLISIETEENKT